MTDNKKSNLEEVYSEWQNNPAFRQEFKKNPQQALANAHLELNNDDLVKVLSLFGVKSSNDDDELEQRINK